MTSTRTAVLRAAVAAMMLAPAACASHPGQAVRDSISSPEWTFGD